MFIKVAKFLVMVTLVSVVIACLHIGKAAAFSTTPVVLKVGIPSSKTIELQLSAGTYNSFSGNPEDFAVSGAKNNPFVTEVTIVGVIVKLTLSQPIVTNDIPKLSYTKTNSVISNNSLQELQSFASLNVDFVPVPTILSAGTLGSDRIVLNMLSIMSSYEFIGDFSAFKIIGTLKNPVTVINVQLIDYTITLQLSGQIEYGDVFKVIYTPSPTTNVTNGIYNIAAINRDVINQVKQPLPIPAISNVEAIDSDSSVTLNTDDIIRIKFNTGLSSQSVTDLTSLFESTAYDIFGVETRAVTWWNSNTTVDIKLGFNKKTPGLIQLDHSFYLDRFSVYNASGNIPENDLTVTIPATLTSVPSIDSGLGAHTSAILNAARDEIILYMPAELSTSYALDPNNFNIYTPEQLNISDIEYLIADSSNRAVKITLAAAVPVNSLNLSFSLNSHALLTIDNRTNNTTSNTAITTFDLLDLTHNGSIDIVDVVSMIQEPAMQMNLNHDSKFDREDIGLLLAQIKSVLEGKIEN